MLEQTDRHVHILYSYETQGGQHKPENLRHINALQERNPLMKLLMKMSDTILA